MLLTPLEAAIIMSACERQTVTVRQVYYRLTMFRVLGIKIGNALRIPEKELEVYYDDIGKRELGKRVSEFTGYLKHKTNGVIFANELQHDIPIDLKRAIESVAQWRREILEHKQKRNNKILKPERNNQLEFNFAA